MCLVFDNVLDCIWLPSHTHCHRSKFHLYHCLNIILLFQRKFVWDVAAIFVECQHELTSIQIIIPLLWRTEVHYNKLTSFAKCFGVSAWCVYHTLWEKDDEKEVETFRDFISSMQIYLCYLRDTQHCEIHNIMYKKIHGIYIKYLRSL